MDCRVLAIRVAAVLCGALIEWSCANGSSSSSSGSAGFSGGGFAGSEEDAGIVGVSTGRPGMPTVATLCGDPECPPLPGADATTEDMDAGRRVMEGGSEASADASMADGAGQDQDASTDGPRSDSGGDGGSPDSEAAGD